MSYPKKAKSAKTAHETEARKIIGRLLDCGSKHVIKPHGRQGIFQTWSHSDKHYAIPQLE